MEKRIKELTSRGLSENEAKTFIELLNKYQPTKSDRTDFNFTMNSEIPFEGGMCFTEALCGAKLVLERHLNTNDINYGQIVIDVVNELKSEKTISLSEIKDNFENFFSREITHDELEEFKRLFAEQGVTVVQ